MKLKLLVKNVKYMAKVKSPQIKAVCAAVGVVGGAIWACKATLKAKTIVDTYKDDKAEIESQDDFQDEVTHAMAKRNLKLAKDLGICYAGPALMIGGSMILGFKGMKELNERYLGAVATAGTFQQALADYRQRVAKKIGVEEEQNLYHDVNFVDIKKDDGKGNIKELKKAPVVNTAPMSPLTVLFCERERNSYYGSYLFVKGRNDLNLMNLKNVQRAANDALIAGGDGNFMTLYDILVNYLRMDPRCLKDPMMALNWGWKYTADNSDPTSDNYIDFGIWDAYWRLKSDDALDYAHYEVKDLFLDFNATPLFAIDKTKENKLEDVLKK